MVARPTIKRRADIAASTIGGFVAITLVMWLSDLLVGDGSPFVVASIGSSAVILLAAPEAPAAQPRPVFIGHLSGALLGVTCATLLGSGPISAALAVSLTLCAMLCLGAVHPPAGATALTAVVGGAAITDLGYRFVVAPVLFNVVIIVVITYVAAALVPWRRYPVKPVAVVTSDHDDDGVRAGS